MTSSDEAYLLGLAAGFRTAILSDLVKVSDNGDKRWNYPRYKGCLFKGLLRPEKLYPQVLRTCRQMCEG